MYRKETLIVYDMMTPVIGKWWKYLQKRLTSKDGGCYHVNVFKKRWIVTR